MTTEPKEQAGYSNSFTFHAGEGGKLSVVQTVMYGQGKVRVVTTFNNGGDRESYTQEVTSPRGMDAALTQAQEQWNILKNELMNIKTVVTGYMRYKTNEVPKPEIVDEVLSQVFESYASGFNCISADTKGLLDKGITKLRDSLTMVRNAAPDVYDDYYEHKPSVRQKIKLDSVETRLLGIEDKMPEVIDAIDYVVDEAKETDKVMAEEAQLAKKADAFYNAVADAIESINLAWFVTANDLRPWNGWKRQFSYDEEGNVMRVGALKKAYAEFENAAKGIVPDKGMRKIHAMAAGQNEEEPSVLSLFASVMHDLRDKKTFKGRVASGISSSRGL